MRLLVLAAAAAVAAAQLTPIPARYDGWKIGNADAPILVEAFFDLMCPDSRAANPTMKALRSFYGPAKVQFVQHIFPLPYHLSATWVAAEGVEIVSHLQGAPAVWKWIDAVFANQESFGYDYSINATRAQLNAKFGQLYATTFGASASAFVNAYADPTLNNNARISWKYGCSRGVSGTPFFFVNGVLTDASADWSLSQWQALIDPLLADPSLPAQTMAKAVAPDTGAMSQVA